jgi:hypothetical protein
VSAESRRLGHISEAEILRKGVRERRQLISASAVPGKGENRTRAMSRLCAAKGPIQNRGPTATRT